VQVALDPPAVAVLRGHDPAARRLDLGQAHGGPRVQRGVLQRQRRREQGRVQQPRLLGKPIVEVHDGHRGAAGRHRTPQPARPRLGEVGGRAVERDHARTVHIGHRGVRVVDRTAQRVDEVGRRASAGPQPWVNSSRARTASQVRRSNRRSTIPRTNRSNGRNAAATASVAAATATPEPSPNRVDSAHEVTAGRLAEPPGRSATDQPGGSHCEPPRETVGNTSLTPIVKRVHHCLRGQSFQFPAAEIYSAMERWR
jgi:hypothetical protein